MNDMWHFYFAWVISFQLSSRGLKLANFTVWDLVRSNMFNKTMLDKTCKKIFPWKLLDTKRWELLSFFTDQADNFCSKLFISFAGVKCKYNFLKEEFKPKCPIASSPNVRMNVELTLTNVDSIIYWFTFN